MSQREDIRMILSMGAIGILAGVIALLVQYTYPPGGEKSSPPWPAVDHQKIAVDELNNYSAYSGWGATFSHEGDTLRMTGFSLCEDDFLDMIPPEAKKIAVDNFAWFRCWHGNQKAVVQLHKNEP